MQNKREKRKGGGGGGKKLRLKIRKKNFLLWQMVNICGQETLCFSSQSLIFHTVCGRTPLSGKDLLGLPCYSTSSGFNLQSHSPCAPPKFLKLSFILIVLSTTHTQVLNLHQRLLQYTPDRCIFKTSFWNFSLNILKLLWYRMHVYIWN